MTISCSSGGAPEAAQRVRVVRRRRRSPYHGRLRMRNRGGAYVESEGPPTRRVAEIRTARMATGAHTRDGRRLLGSRRGVATDPQPPLGARSALREAEGKNRQHRQTGLPPPCCGGPRNPARVPRGEPPGSRGLGASRGRMRSSDGSGPNRTMPQSESGDKAPSGPVREAVRRRPQSLLPGASLAGEGVPCAGGERAGRPPVYGAYRGGQPIGLHTMCGPIRCVRAVSAPIFPPKTR